LAESRKPFYQSERIPALAIIFQFALISAFDFRLNLLHSTFLSYAPLKFGVLQSQPQLEKTLVYCTGYDWGGRAMVIRFKEERSPQRGRRCAWRKKHDEFFVVV